MLSKFSDVLLEIYVRADTPKPGDATQPPGFAKVTDILGWVKWLSLAVCVAAVMIVFARLSASKRASSDEPAQVGWILISVIGISAAGSLVSFLAA
jgi:hypothetical protein